MLTGSDDKYLGLLREVTQRTAKTVAGWQCVGFVHGVLNTDNMSILGETIDYGCAVCTPCACFQLPVVHQRPELHAETAMLLKCFSPSVTAAVQ